MTGSNSSQMKPKEGFLGMKSKDYKYLRAPK